MHFSSFTSIGNRGRIGHNYKDYTKKTEILFGIVEIYHGHEATLIYLKEFGHGYGINVECVSVAYSCPCLFVFMHVRVPSLPVRVSAYSCPYLLKIQRVSSQTTFQPPPRQDNPSHLGGMDATQCSFHSFLLWLVMHQWVHLSWPRASDEYVVFIEQHLFNGNVVGPYLALNWLNVTWCLNTIWLFIVFKHALDATVYRLQRLTCKLEHSPHTMSPWRRSFAPQS